MPLESPFSQIFTAIFANTTNITAFIAIVILTLLALFGTSPRLKQYAKQSPSIIATVGIFFSFWGISLGLIGLDLTDIKNSIPHLLDGLKVKFIASLMGIFASIVVRVVQSFKLEKDDVIIDNESIMIELLKDIKQSLSESAKNSPEQLFKELKEAIDILPSEFKKQSGLLESIKTSLAGEGDASVTTQLMKVRTDMKDSLGELDKHNRQYFEDLNTNNKQYLGAIGNSIVKGFDNQNELLDKNQIKLIERFDEFAKVLAENNSKAFIEALEKAMRDFNNNITEQFGENFKELNRAVGELLHWQDNYKAHVEKLTDNFAIALNSIETIKIAFDSVQNRSQSFTTVSDELHTILQSLDRQLKDLDNHLKAFDGLADNAKTAFPVIEDNLKKLTTGFKTSTEQSLADINETVKDVGDNLKETSNKFKETTVKMRDVMDEQKDTLDNSSKDFKKVVGDTLKNVAKETQSSIDNYRDTLQETVSEQLRVIDGSIKKSNNLLNESVEKASTTFENSINATGDKLTTATTKISNQLTAATDNIQSVLETQTNILDKTSKDFKDVVKQTLYDLSTETQASFKDYQQNLERVINTQAETLNRAIQNAGNEFDITIKTTAKQFETMGNTIQQSVNTQERILIGVSDNVKTTVDKTLRDLAEQSNSHIKRYETELQNAINNQMNNINSAIKNSSDQFNKLLTENTTKSTSVLEQQTKLLDAALQEELKKSIELLGTLLTRLSRKFVDDYSPLTDKLRDVVHLADELKRGRN